MKKLITKFGIIIIIMKNKLFPKKPTLINQLFLKLIIFLILLIANEIFLLSQVDKFRIIEITSREGEEIAKIDVGFINNVIKNLSGRIYYLDKGTRRYIAEFQVIQVEEKESLIKIINKAKNVALQIGYFVEFYETLKGTLTLETNPTGAEIYIKGNNNPLGKTPIKQVMRPGNYDFIIKLEGYVEKSIKINIKPGEARHETISLEPINEKTGSIEIITKPENADVYINNILMGRSPLELRLSPGSYKLDIAKESYSSISEEVTISEKEKIKKYYVLEFKKTVASDLKIITEPESATIYLDNAKLEQPTPVEIKNLDKAKVNIKIEKDGYKTIEDEIELTGGLIEKRYTLEKIKLTLKINTEPMGSGIYLNESYIGTSPIEVYLEKGFYNLRIKQEGYKTITQNINLNENCELNFNLEKIGTGILTIFAFPEAQRIEVDNLDYGACPPQKVLKLYEGEHTVKIVFNSDEEAILVEKIFIKEGEETKIVRHLDKSIPLFENKSRYEIFSSSEIAVQIDSSKEKPCPPTVRKWVKNGLHSLKFTFFSRTKKEKVLHLILNDEIENVDIRGTKKIVISYDEISLNNFKDINKYSNLLSEIKINDIAIFIESNSIFEIEHHKSKIKSLHNIDYEKNFIFFKIDSKYGKQLLINPIELLGKTYFTLIIFDLGNNICHLINLNINYQLT